MLRARVMGLAAILFAWTSTGTAAPCAGFNDVDTNDPVMAGACPSIEWMKNRAITFGTSDTTYSPNDPVTRLQMAAFMYRLGFQNAFLRGGNAFGATAVLGTTDNRDVEIRVGGFSAMHYEWTGFAIPNVIGGAGDNGVVGPVFGGTVAGGGNDLRPNLITDIYGSVGGGAGNTAGSFAAIPGGFRNEALGAESFAAGSYARANANRCAVFSLWGGPPGMPCFGVGGGFNVGAPGGYAFDFGSQRGDGGGTRWIAFGRFGGQAISTQAGGFLSDPGGIWVDGSSSREAKTDFEYVDTSDILDKVASLPITTWRFRGGEVRHIGPMAEDFASAFDVGFGPHTISNLDARGVALAAIQGLNTKLESKLAEKDARIAALERSNDELRRAVEALLARSGVAASH